MLDNFQLGLGSDGASFMNHRERDTKTARITDLVGIVRTAGIARKNLHGES